MSWYAVDALDDAFDATKALLTPLDARQWLTLAAVVFFLGSGGSGGSSATAGSSAGSGGPPGPAGVGTDLQLTVSEVLPVILGAIAVALAVGLVYALVGSVMEFVFVESLRRERVRVRRYADQHLERALRLFGFRVVLGLVVALPALGVVLAAVSFAGGEPRLSAGLLLVVVPLLVGLGVVVALADGFTTNFVVPVMIQRNVGVLDGWRLFWPALSRQWRQFGAYVLVRVVLLAAAGALASVVGAVVGAVLFAPLAVVLFFAVPALGGQAALLANPAAVMVGLVVLLVYVGLLFAVTAAAFVPVQTFLRYHALFVLGDADSAFDLIPDLRRSIRDGRVG